MKIVAKSNSKNLRKEDVQQPFIAIISDVRVHTFAANSRSPREDKDMLHFTDPNVKPLGLNVTNKRILIAAYGDESDHWRGKPVEVYVDPNVTNSSGEIVGGIRLRIPAAATLAPPPIAPGNATAPKPFPTPARTQAPPPAAAPRPAPAPGTPNPDAHRQAIQGMRQAKTRSDLERWWAHAKTLPATEEQWREFEHAYDGAMERLAVAEAPTQPRRQMRVS